MENKDLSIFTLEDLEELKGNALNTYKLIKKQIAGIPQIAIPTLKQIELDSLETKIKLYENEINSRQFHNLEPIDRYESDSDIKSKIKQYISANATQKAIAELMLITKNNDPVNNEVVLLSNRFNKLKHDERNTLKNREEILIESSRINQALLELLVNFK